MNEAQAFTTSLNHQPPNSSFTGRRKCQCHLWHTGRFLISVLWTSFFSPARWHTVFIGFFSTPESFSNLSLTTHLPVTTLAYRHAHNDNADIFIFRRCNVAVVNENVFCVFEVEILSWSCCWAGGRDTAVPAESSVAIMKNEIWFYFSLRRSSKTQFCCGWPAALEEWIKRCGPLTHCIPMELKGNVLALIVKVSSIYKSSLLLRPKRPASPL